MANHYITIDSENRIIDGFTDSFKWPGPADILIRENGGEVFELFGGDPGRPLSFVTHGVEVWMFKWTGETVAQRSQTEINTDLPPLPDTPSLEDQIAANTYDIETLNMALNILINGG